jgi:hypothetical protein
MKSEVEMSLTLPLPAHHLSPLSSFVHLFLPLSQLTAVVMTGLYGGLKGVQGSDAKDAITLTLYPPLLLIPHSISHIRTVGTKETRVNTEPTQHNTTQQHKRG